MVLKIGKNGLEARKLWPFEVGGGEGGSFLQKFFDQITYSLFSNPSKNP
jgi:hypothetical protein